MQQSFFDKGLGWPVAIVGLLLFSVATMGTFLFAANSDGGAQVVESYYEQAVHWDSLAAAQNELANRKWIAVVMIEKDRGQFYVQDENGQRVNQLEGNVTLSRPHLSAPVGTTALQAVEADSSYLFPFPDAKAGLWDFTFDLFDGPTPIQIVVRKDVMD